MAQRMSEIYCTMVLSVRARGEHASCDSFATEIRPLALLTSPEGHGFNPFEDARRRLSLKEI